MNECLLQSHHEDLRLTLTTFFAASARRDDDAEAPLSDHALAEDMLAAELKAIDFDAVKRKWYPWDRVHNVPCSVDAVTYEREGTYLVEFKCGKAEIDNVIRKVYDSVLMLMEHDGLTIRQARTGYTYLVVSNDLTIWNNRLKALSRSLAYCHEPWVRYRKSFDQWRLANLEGVVVAKAYAMPPEMFNLFAKVHHWR